MGGSTEEERDELERGMVNVLSHLNQLKRNDEIDSIDNVPGAGAAGGISGGFLAGLDAKLKRVRRIEDIVFSSYNSSMIIPIISSSPFFFFTYLIFNIGN